MFGSYHIFPYLCIVKDILFLTTPLSAGSKPVSKLLHLKVTYQVTFIFHIVF